VRDEDLDWAVYHLIGDRTISTTAESIAACLHQPPERIEESLQRLERNLLIERSGGNLRLVSFAEAIARCQLKYCNDMPVYIENGVIKAKPERKG
jgi:Mn-dependent DtxR family transcriptional regulator